MSNIDIRKVAKQNGVFLYEIAKELNINDGNFSRKLRYELAESEKEKIFKIINKLKEERGQ